jgi:hypothetical protein
VSGAAAHFTGSGDAESGGTDLPTRFRRHADSIERAGRSPLSVALMRGGADDIESGGVLADLVEGIPLPPGQAPALRVLAALHRTVLEGLAPGLSPYYPTVGGALPPDGVWPVAEAALRENADYVRSCLHRGVQTNEPGRSAVLFGVLLWVTRRFGQPVRLFEIGASAGLNLLATEYSYRVHGSVLGRRDSRVVFDEPWVSEPVTDLIGADRDLVVAQRRGCDVAPIDSTSSEGRITLMSYIWPDEAERVARMRAAIDVAEKHPPVVDEESADQWLTRVLRPSDDVRSGPSVRVVWQSVMAQYLTPEIRSAVSDQIDEAGATAADEGPLVYARMEPGDYPVRSFQVVVSCWPGGAGLALAHAGDHGPPVHWIELGDDSETRR